MNWNHMINALPKHGANQFCFLKINHILKTHTTLQETQHLLLLAVHLSLSGLLK